PGFTISKFWAVFAIRISFTGELQTFHCTTTEKPVARLTDRLLPAVKFLNGWGVLGEGGCVDGAAGLCPRRTAEAAVATCMRKVASRLGRIENCENLKLDLRRLRHFSGGR